MCIVSDYSTLLQQKTAFEATLASLPRGHISHKTIKGRTYTYLQNRVNGKMTSSYLKADEEPAITRDLEQRRQQEEALSVLNHKIAELETQAEDMDKSAFRRMMAVKLCWNMDFMDSRQKQKSVSFANAMNAIEGVPASDAMAEDFYKWKNGRLSFLSLFESTLKRYGFPTEGSV